MILLGVRLWLLLREEPSSTSLHSNLCLEELARGWEPGWMHSWHKAFPLSWQGPPGIPFPPQLLQRMTPFTKHLFS